MKTRLKNLEVRLNDNHKKVSIYDERMTFIGSTVDEKDANDIVHCVNINFELAEALNAAVRWIKNNTDKTCLRMEDFEDVLKRAKGGE